MRSTGSWRQVAFDDDGWRLKTDAAEQPARATSTSKSTTPTPTGNTEINFAAFGMVGMRFCPRIRSLHCQRIYCADPARDHGVFEPGPQARPSGGELPPHRREWDRIGQFYAAFPAGACHDVGRPAEAQPLPGLEPLLRRQPRARPGCSTSGCLREGAKSYV